MANFLKRLRRIFKNEKKSSSKFYIGLEPELKSEPKEDAFNPLFRSPLQDQEPIYDIPKSGNFGNTNLQDQEPIYDVPKFGNFDNTSLQDQEPIYDVPKFGNFDNTSLQDQNPIYDVLNSGNFDKNSLQKPIYGSIKRIKDMAPQTDLSSPSSEGLSSLMFSPTDSSISSTSLSSLSLPPPPPPPPPGYFDTPDPLAEAKRRKAAKNSGKQAQTAKDKTTNNPSHGQPLVTQEQLTKVKLKKTVVSKRINEKAPDELEEALKKRRKKVI